MQIDHYVRRQTIPNRKVFWEPTSHLAISPLHPHTAPMPSALLREAMSESIQDLECDRNGTKLMRWRSWACCVSTRWISPCSLPRCLFISLIPTRIYPLRQITILSSTSSHSGSQIPLSLTHIYSLQQITILSSTKSRSGYQIHFWLVLSLLATIGPPTPLLSIPSRVATFDPWFL